MSIEVGDIVQLDPTIHTHHNGFWAGQLITVTEVKSWGIQGFIQVPDGRAYYRAKNETFVRVGHVEWILERDE